MWPRIAITRRHLHECSIGSVTKIRSSEVSNNRCRSSFRGSRDLRLLCLGDVARDLRRADDLAGRSDRRMLSETVMRRRPCGRERCRSAGSFSARDLLEDLAGFIPATLVAVRLIFCPIASRPSNRTCARPPHSIQGSCRRVILPQSRRSTTRRWPQTGFLIRKPRPVGWLTLRQGDQPTVAPAAPVSATTQDMLAAARP